MRAFIDRLDVRPCRQCGQEVLRVPDQDDGWSGCVRLELASRLGSDVVAQRGPHHLGWSHTGRFWRLHRFADHPHTYAFLEHSCSGPEVSREGTRMTADPFGTAAPPGATGPGTDELEGKLLLLTVNNIDRGIATKFGPADAVRCDVVDLESGEAYTDTLLFGKVLTNQLAPGTKYVGRLGRGQASGTNSPPWVWNDGSPEDKQVAIKYLTYAAGNSVGQAAPAAPAPAAPAATPAAAPPWAS